MSKSLLVIALMAILSLFVVACTTPAPTVAPTSAPQLVASPPSQNGWLSFQKASATGVMWNELTVVKNETGATKLEDGKGRKISAQIQTTGAVDGSRHVLYVTYYYGDGKLVVASFTPTGITPTGSWNYSLTTGTVNQAVSINDGDVFAMNEVGRSDTFFVKKTSNAWAVGVKK